MVIHYQQRDQRALYKIKQRILSRVSEPALKRQFPQLVRRAIDFVCDPIHTGRHDISALDNAERTFISLKVEHYIRHMLKVPKGRRDLELGDIDLDVKGTVRDTWMIPPESFGDPCLLVKMDDANKQCSLGLLVMREAYLNAPNRDQKRSVSKDAFEYILWIVRDATYGSSIYA
jgi:hypothetical protein